MSDEYCSPFSGRYSSKEMKYLFSEQFKFSTFRKLWVALAEAEQELGLSISDEQIDEMKSYVNDINFSVAQAREREIRHDVMSHVYAYGVQCPKAKPIIHLGATSCYVGDNTDIIIIKSALDLVEKRLCSVIYSLARFAQEYKDMPTLGYTHFQPAQPTTVGKRACLWINDFMSDLADLRFVRGTVLPLGCRGTTGTSASFLELFDGDTDKPFALDTIVANKMGFAKSVDVSGQTYSRKLDSRVVNVLAGIAQSATKFATDMRLLQHLKELEEPFEKNQVGSSAMPYKRNPMRCERICSLARYIIADSLNPAMTACSQWFERTLDDSANRRLSLSEGFLAADAVLMLCENVSKGIVVYPRVIAANLAAELPFMATETILMDAVKRGLDRQDIHERLRTHSLAAADRVKREGLDNDLLSRIAADPAFKLDKPYLESLLCPDRFTGVAAIQTEKYICETVLPAVDCECTKSDETEINL
ncbi:MAG: adenylosuccinate lyase [Oscillospiraceae bacterium]